MDAAVAKHRPLFVEAMERWGRTAQVLMVIEETGELLAALGKFSRGRVNTEEVVTEIADVRIMLAQIEVLCDIADGDVEAEIDRKLRRLSSRLLRAAA